MKEKPMMADMPEPPPTRIRMTKSQVGQFAVGDRINVTVRGSVSGVHQCYDDKEMYEVELKSSAVSSILSDNSADKAYKKLAKE